MANQFSLADIQNQLSAQTGGNIPAQPAQLTPAAQQDQSLVNQGMTKDPGTNDWYNKKMRETDDHVEEMVKQFKQGYVPANQLPKGVPTEVAQGVAQQRQSTFTDKLLKGEITQDQLPDLIKQGLLTPEDANMAIQNFKYVKRKQVEDEQKKNQPKQSSPTPGQPTPGLIPDILNPSTPMGIVARNAIFSNRK